MKAGSVGRTNKAAKLARAFTKSPIFMAKFFWSGKDDMYYLPPADFHYKIMKDACKVAAKILVIPVPRGFGKTKLMSVLFSIWSIFMNRRNYVMLISHTDGKSKQSLRDIMQCIEKERFRKIFKWEKGPIWRQELKQIIIGDRLVTIECKGTGMQVFGACEGQSRPDLIILDDIIDLKIAKNKDRIDGYQNWFDVELLPALSTADYYGRPGQIIYIDTFKDVDCLLARAVKWKADTKVRKYPVLDAKTPLPAYPQGTSIWEAKESTESLYKKMESYRIRGSYDAWLSQYMLKPEAAKNLRFEQKKLTPLLPEIIKKNLKQNKYNVRIIVDVAYSEKTWADHCGIVVCGHFKDYKNQANYLDFIEAHKGKHDPIQLYDLLYSIYQKYKKWCDEIFMETNAWGFVQQAFNQKSVLDRKELPISPMNRPKRFYHQSKIERIGMLVPYYIIGLMRVCEEDCLPLIAQMWAFDGKDHGDDDVIDAASHNIFFVEGAEELESAKREEEYIPDKYNASLHIEKVFAEQERQSQMWDDEEAEDEYFFNTFF